MKMTRTGRTLVAVMAVILLLAPGAVFGAKEPNKKIVSKLKLAQTYFLNNRLAEALEQVNGVLEKEEKYPQAHQLRGQILLAMDAVEDALHEFDRVLDLDSSYTEARNWRAYALVQLERFDEAMKEYRRALEDRTYPTPEKIHANMGMLLRLQSRHTEAIESLEESVRLNPSYAKGFYELGVTYSELGDQAKAREFFENVIQLAPEGPEADKAREKIKELRASS